jgi:acyl dehydratase
MLTKEVAAMPVAVGQSTRLTKMVTRHDVALYAQMSGDTNPLHTDEEYAGRSRFGRLTVQGGVTVGLLHALINQLPGPGSVFMSQNLTYRAPAYVGEQLTAHAVVTEVHQTKPVCRMKMWVENDIGMTVLDADCWVYMLGDEMPDSPQA